SANAGKGRAGAACPDWVDARPPPPVSTPPLGSADAAAASTTGRRRTTVAGLLRTNSVTTLPPATVTAAVRSTELPVLEVTRSVQRPSCTAAYGPTEPYLASCTSTGPWTAA